MGPFFKRLSRDLEGLGDATVYKINFNAGDWLFYRGANAVNFRGTQEQWPDFLAEKINEWHIDTIYLFGDTRSYHKLAREVARRFSVKVGVFEEGYLRPHYVTLEEGGVNNRSSLSRDPDFYRNLTVPQKPQPQPIPVSHPYCCTAWYAVCYYVAGWLGCHRFPHYVHHRSFNTLDETFLWLRAGFRKYYYRLRERGILGKLSTEYSGKYYLSPLQVHCDGQIRTCEGIPSAAFFIRRTIRSFVRNAPSGTLLVLKHHPLCRGYSDYTRLIQKLTRRYGCQDRVIYVHDLHLPTLLQHALGTIVMNSTAGLSSLWHNTPVIALGRTVYDIQGLTFQGKLDDFWQAPGKVDQDLYRKFRSYLLKTNQINGNFYKTHGSKTSETGMDVRRLVIGSPGFTIRKDSVTEAPAVWANIAWHQAEPAPQIASDSAVPAHPSSYAYGQAAAAEAPGDTPAGPGQG
jgi:capsule polysaccharide modification protein KpsS